MDMLTTAVVMPTSGEQAGGLPVSSDRVQVEGASFAKSFDQQVALAGDAATKASSDEDVREMRNPASGTPLQATGELVAASVLIKAGASSAQTGSGAEDGKSMAVTSVHGSLISIVPVAETNTKTSSGVGTAVDAASPVPSSLLVQTPEDDVGAAQKLASGTIEEVAGTHPAVPNDAPAVAATEIVTGKRQDRPVVLRDVEGTLGKKKIMAESAVPVASATKTSRGQERKAAHTKTQETANAIGLVTATGANAVLDAGALVGASVPVSVVVPVPAKSNGFATTSKGSSGNAMGKTIGTAISTTELKRIAAAAVAGQNGGAAPGDGKAGAGAAPVVPSADEVGSANAGSDSAKTASLALAIGTGDAGKTQKADAAGSLHDTAAGVSFTGSISGVVPLHGVGGAASTNVQAQDGSAQTTTGPHAVHGELDGSGGAAAQAMDGAHRTLAVTPTTLEVGVANGTHGWLKIRAELATGGGVNASLSAASPGGQEMLHRELPALTAYLQQEQVAVNTVVVHAMTGNDSHSLAGGTGGDVSGQAQQRNDQRGETRQGLNGPVSNYAEEVVSNGTSGVGAEGLLSPVTYAGGGGSWLNVRV